MNRWAVVLAGGVGSRFWPLSTPELPKQLLPLLSERPMLADSIDRLSTIAPPERVLVLTNASLAARVRELMPELPEENVIAEPRPAGTAAALAWAASEVARRGGRDATMVCVHADWAIGDVRRFRESLAAAAAMAEAQHALVTVGIVPTRPEPGFGYIQPGDSIGDNAWTVARFIEKPDRSRAEWMWHQGYLWNSGIFAWRASDFLDELHALTPEVAPALDASNGDAARFFAGVKTPIAVDVGVLERSRRVVVMPGEFGWDDVGTWASLRRVRQTDDSGNTVHGRAHLREAAGNVVHADGGTVVLYGVSDLVVVSRDGLILVTTMERAADLKSLTESLPPELLAR